MLNKHKPFVQGEESCFEGDKLNFNNVKCYLGLEQKSNLRRI